MGKAHKGIREDTSCVYHIPYDCFTHHSTKYNYSWGQNQQDSRWSWISSTSPTAPGRTVLDPADAGNMSYLLISSQNLLVANLQPPSLLSTRLKYLFILTHLTVNSSECESLISFYLHMLDKPDLSPTFTKQDDPYSSSLYPVSSS